MAGLLQARLPELGLEDVPDPRARQGRWSLAQILRAALLGLLAGCGSLAETEALTDSLAPVMRRRLGLPRRLAARSMRDSISVEHPDWETDRVEALLAERMSYLASRRMHVRIPGSCL